MLPYLAEFLGTMMLIMLGDGVCCNVNLSKSGMKGGGTVQITLAWAAAVTVSYTHLTLPTILLV